MNMNFKTEQVDIEKLRAHLSKLSHFNNDEEKLDLEAEAIHLDIMHTIRSIMGEQHMSKKDLAKKLETSPSYVTQLFSADKIVNLKTLAKIQRALNMRFEFRAERVFKINRTGESKFKAIEKQIDSMESLKKAAVGNLRKLSLQGLNQKVGSISQTNNTSLAVA